MSLVVYQHNCTLTIEWPARCYRFSGLNERFIVEVTDSDSGYRMLTRPLSVDSLVLHVAVPEYFSSSSYGLTVTVHLCCALMNEAGWKTVESLTTCAVHVDHKNFSWQSDCEHGPTSRQYFVTFKITVLLKCDITLAHRFKLILLFVVSILSSYIEKFIVVAMMLSLATIVY